MKSWQAIFDRNANTSYVEKALRGIANQRREEGRLNRRASCPVMSMTLEPSGAVSTHYTEKL